MAAKAIDRNSLPTIIPKKLVKIFLDLFFVTLSMIISDVRFNRRKNSNKIQIM